MPIPSPPQGSERDLRAFIRYVADQPRGTVVLVAIHGLVIFGPAMIGTRFGSIGSLVGFAIGVALVATFWAIVLRSGRKRPGD